MKPGLLYESFRKQVGGLEQRRGLGWKEVSVWGEKDLQCREEKTTPELAAAVGIAGHNRGRRHAAWISRRSGKGFIGTTVGGGDLTWILVVMGSLLAIKS